MFDACDLPPKIESCPSAATRGERDKLGYDGIANCVIQAAFRLENCTGGFVREAGKLVFAIGFTTTLTVNAVETQQTPQPR